MKCTVWTINSRHSSWQVMDTINFKCDIFFIPPNGNFKLKFIFFKFDFSARSTATDKPNSANKSHLYVLCMVLVLSEPVYKVPIIKLREHLNYVSVCIWRATKMDLVNIAGLEGVVVGGEFDQDNSFQLVSTTFGCGSGGPLLRITHSGIGSTLFTGDIGKLQERIFKAACVIIVLNDNLIQVLRSLLPTTLSKKLVLFSSAFGMEPKRFFHPDQYVESENDTAGSEAKTVQVATDIQTFLMKSKIFSAWMKYIKGENLNFSLSHVQLISYKHSFRTH